MRRAAPLSSARVLVTIAALLLASCTGGAGGGSAGSTAASVEQDGGDETLRTAGRTPDGARPEPRIDADPKRLIGLDGAGITAMLGDPEFRRRDAPAELWRYRSESCLLDLFLYEPEKAAAKPRGTQVRHVESRSTGEAAVTTTDCLRALLRARLVRRAG